MPWPAQIPALLRRPDSQAAEALRWSLRAMRGCLQAALDEGPNDPDAPAARGLLAELDALLGPAGHNSAAVTPTAPPPPAGQPPPRPDGLRLSSLARAIAADASLRAELGDS